MAGNVEGLVGQSQAAGPVGLRSPGERPGRPSFPKPSSRYRAPGRGCRVAGHAPGTRPLSWSPLICSTRRPRIVVATGEPRLLRRVHHRLGRAGYHVLPAADGEAALHPTSDGQTSRGRRACSTQRTGQIPREVREAGRRDSGRYHDSRVRRGRDRHVQVGAVRACRSRSASPSSTRHVRGSTLATARARAGNPPLPPRRSPAGSSVSFTRGASQVRALLCLIQPARSNERKRHGRAGQAGHRRSVHARRPARPRRPLPPRRAALADEADGGGRGGGWLNTALAASEHSGPRASSRAGSVALRENFKPLPPARPSPACSLGSCGVRLALASGGEACGRRRTRDGAGAGSVSRALGWTRRFASPPGGPGPASPSMRSP